MQQILLGPAGSPAKSTLEGITSVKKLGLQAMEVQYTHGIKMNLALAEEVGKVAQKEEISLSIHAPYYINLLSSDPKILEASRLRILDSCHRGHLMGATKVIFHPGYYGKRSKEDAYEMIKQELKEIQKTVKENKWNIDIAPETMGRVFQFGNFNEIMSLVKELKCNFCVDISHIYALNQGKIDYDEVFDVIEKLRKDIHFHFQGIEYNKNGEKRHLVLNGKPDFKDFARHLLESKLDATIICESPVTWQDSLKMKKVLEGLGYKF